MLKIFFALLAFLPLSAFAADPPPMVCFTVAESQQIAQALASPTFQMTLARIQQAEREAQHKEPETPKP